MGAIEVLNRSSSGIILERSEPKIELPSIIPGSKGVVERVLNVVSYYWRGPENHLERHLHDKSRNHTYYPIYVLKYLTLKVIAITNPILINKISLENEEEFRIRFFKRLQTFLHDPSFLKLLSVLKLSKGNSPRLPNTNISRLTNLKGSQVRKFSNPITQLANYSLSKLPFNEPIFIAEHLQRYIIKALIENILGWEFSKDQTSLSARVKLSNLANEMNNIFMSTAHIDDYKAKTKEHAQKIIELSKDKYSENEDIPLTSFEKRRFSKDTNLLGVLMNCAGASLPDDIVEEELIHLKKMIEENINEQTLIDFIQELFGYGTSVIVSWLLSALSFMGNKDYDFWIKNLEEEINNSNSLIDSQNLKKFRYMDAFLKEAWRLKTPISNKETINRSEKIIDGYRIPAHSKINLMYSLSHKDEYWWKEANTFNPLRFLKEEHNEKQLLYFTSECITSRFAEMIAKIFLIEWIKMAKITACHKIKSKSDKSLVNLQPLMIEIKSKCI